DGKIYDACVLYTKSSGGRSLCRLETFVHRAIPEVLEQQCGYNLFILGRDDLPGEAVVGVADETLKQSRRLIIIVGSEASSYSLLEDTSEQQLAIYNALIRDGIQVILIEMDEIQDYTSMPESIRYIKQKHGAIQWKADFSEKSCSANTRFWKNVRYQMPPRKNVS
ncbi:ILRL2 protein, partial [Syrrhaptes paradoxus]|nr:ILRL2 protein [Syrrhaptes paradoxus]